MTRVLFSLRASFVTKEAQSLVAAPCPELMQTLSARLEQLGTEPSQATSSFNHAQRPWLVGQLCAGLRYPVSVNLALRELIERAIENPFAMEVLALNTALLQFLNIQKL